jgi:hypothetical protein
LIASDPGKLKKLHFFILFSAALILTCCQYFRGSEDNSQQEKAHIELAYRIDSPDGKFTVSFPGKPDFASEPIESEHGSILNNMYIYEHSSSLAYMLAFTDYPDNHIAPYDPYELLDNAMYGFVDEVGLKVDSAEKISSGSYPGIEFIASGDGFNAHMRDFLVDNRLYQIGILSSTGSLNHSDANAFFDTFSIH